MVVIPLLQRLIRAPRTVTYGLAWEIWCRLPGSARLRLRPHLSTLLPAGPFAPAKGGTPFVASGRVSELPSLPVRVSIVIPTRDAGPGFARTLAVLTGQRGLRETELIVVDSGSSDGTQELAREHGAHLIEIAPGEFSHGGTRELGAGFATGDMLLMTVQDAVLAGPHALRRLCEDLEADDRCAAVSARQVPHSASDIFAAYDVWAHTRAMEGARRLPPTADTPHARRGRAQMDDVCALVRREAWQEIHFRPAPFAEDLDFGLRAVEAGWTIGVSTAAVVHAHVRTAEYHLRRRAVERFHLAPMLESAAGPPTVGDVVSLAGRALVLLGELQAAFTRADGERAALELAPWLAEIAASLRRGLEPDEPGPVLAPLAQLLNPLADRPAAAAPVGAMRDDIALQLEWGAPQAFARAFHGVGRGDAEEFVVKIAAIVIGSTLGDALRRDSTPPKAAEQLLAGV